MRACIFFLFFASPVLICECDAAVVRTTIEDFTGPPVSVRVENTGVAKAAFGNSRLLQVQGKLGTEGPLQASIERSGDEGQLRIQFPGFNPLVDSFNQALLEFGVNEDGAIVGIDHDLSGQDGLSASFKVVERPILLRTSIAVRDGDGFAFYSQEKEIHRPGDVDFRFGLFKLTVAGEIPRGTDPVFFCSDCADDIVAYEYSFRHPIPSQSLDPTIIVSDVGSFAITIVPEPSSAILFGALLPLLGFWVLFRHI